jgi:uncharacterized protein (DUF2164 family)
MKNTKRRKITPKVQIWVRDLEKNIMVQRIAGAFCLEWYAHHTLGPYLT